MYVVQVQHHNHRIRHFLSMSFSSVVGIVGGLIILMLATRYVLSFVEISELPSFTATIYSLSYPFVAPIAKLFDQVAVQSQIAIAIAFWAVVTWLLAGLGALAADADSEN